MPNRRIRSILALIACASLIGSVVAQDYTAPVYRTTPDDPFVSIPEQLTTELKVKVAHNGEEIFWLFETESPGYWLHDMSVFRDGAWAREGGSQVGPKASGVYEDRISFLVDPGTVAGFANQGCYASCHSGSRFLSDQLPSASIREQSLLGVVQGRSDLRKYIPDSRVGEGWWDAPWDATKEAEILSSLQDVGVFLDFWHWRAHRGNPFGFSDDQFVLEYRNNDGTRGAYTANWDAANARPAFMFDESKVGFAALDWEVMTARGYAQDDVYYLTPDNSVPFDPERAWADGNVIPRIILRQPQGAQAAITADGRWDDGVWTVELRRLMDTGYPRVDHALELGRSYDVGFAVHRNATGSRWHYISHPLTVGIGVPAELTSVGFVGDEPAWDGIAWTTVPLYYPSQVTWQFLIDEAQHPGAADVKADNVSCMYCHGTSAADVLDLSQMSIEATEDY